MSSTPLSLIGWSRKSPSMHLSSSLWSHTKAAHKHGVNTACSIRMYRCSNMTSVLSTVSTDIQETHQPLTKPCTEFSPFQFTLWLCSCTYVGALVLRSMSFIIVWDCWHFCTLFDTSLGMIDLLNIEDLGIRGYQSFKNIGLVIFL